MLSVFCHVINQYNWCYFGYWMMAGRPTKNTTPRSRRTLEAPPYVCPAKPQNLALKSPIIWGWNPLFWTGLLFTWHVTYVTSPKKAWQNQKNSLHYADTKSDLSTGCYKLKNSYTYTVPTTDNHYLDIFPPGILSAGNLAKVFRAAGFAREFQCFAASSVRCKLCEPLVVNASQPMW